MQNYSQMIYNKNLFSLFLDADLKNKLFYSSAVRKRCKNVFLGSDSARGPRVDSNGGSLPLQALKIEADLPHQV